MVFFMTSKQPNNVENHRLQELNKVLQKFYDEVGRNCVTLIILPKLHYTTLYEAFSLRQQNRNNVLKY